MAVARRLKQALIFFSRLYSRLVITRLNGGFVGVGERQSHEANSAGKNERLKRNMITMNQSVLLFVKLAFCELANKDEVSTFSFIYSTRFLKIKTSVSIFYLHSFYYFF